VAQGCHNTEVWINDMATLAGTKKKITFKTWKVGGGINTQS